MDLDADLKHLKTFKTRMEALLDGGLIARLEAAAEAVVGGADTTSSEELGKRIDALGEHVTALEQKFDAIQPHLAAVEKLADPAVVDLLDWLASRREAIELLCTLGDTADGTSEDQPNPAPVPLPGGEPQPAAPVPAPDAGTAPAAA